MSDLIPCHAEDAFILVRHAATPPNLVQQTCGSTNAAITATGEAEAVLLGQALRSAIPRPARIYHTGMRRSVQTAMALASAWAPAPDIGCVEAVRERCFGDWELRPWAEVLSRLQQGYPPPGGETESAFIERTMAGLQTVRSARAGLPVIVAHGGTFHALARANGREVREIRNLDCFLFTPAGEGLDSWKLSQEAVWEPASAFI